MLPGDNQVLRGSKGASATASVVPLKYDIIIW